VSDVVTPPTKDSDIDEVSDVVTPPTKDSDEVIYLKSKFKEVSSENEILKKKLCELNDETELRRNSGNWKI